jgi:D-alanyl-D-alanine carboxypeptidase
MSKWFFLSFGIALGMVMIQGEFRIKDFELMVKNEQAKILNDFQIGVYPEKQKDDSLPELTARAVYLVEFDSMVPIYQKNAVTPLPPASTTKVMTALVARDYFDLNQALKVNRELDFYGKEVGLFAGEEISFKELLGGLMLESGNDTAWVLADNYFGGYRSMVEAMNAKAQELGLVGANFESVSGLDSPGQRISARDMVILGRELIEDQYLRELVGLSKKEMSDLSGNTFELENTNELLADSSLRVKGIKTGFTEEAKECLLSWFEVGEKEYLMALMGSEDRFGETKAMIQWLEYRQ